METKKCGDCIHADVCELNEYLPEFSRENDAICCLAFTENSNFVEVVRCKDCKHWHEGTGWCYHHSHFIGAEGEACHPWESNDWKMLNADDFCSYGERRTDGGRTAV